MTCPKCGGSNVNVSVVNEPKSGWRWLWIFVPIIGWAILLFLAFSKGHKTITKALCQNCGKNWDIKQK